MAPASDGSVAVNEAYFHIKYGRRSYNEQSN
jgi:hypothetical protein